MAAETTSLVLCTVQRWLPDQAAMDYRDIGHISRGAMVRAVDETDWCMLV